MVFHPFGNETSLPPAGWHAEPNVHGTFSILSTSLLTLFLCVYTVVHTNLPGFEDDKKTQQLSKLARLSRRLLSPEKWRKIRWMVTAVLAPELVAWNAFEQRRIVREMTEEVQQYLGDTWTNTHSWFAVMGGFAFDISNAPEPFFPNGLRQSTITPEGIKKIAQYWPQLLIKSPLSRDYIHDKSKANGLTKFLACWQTMWFCVQCIFRLSSGLSISLLELNVFGHAVCALLIYVLWWEKPQDVTQPHVFATEETYEAAAALCTASWDGGLSGFRRKVWSDAEVTDDKYGYLRRKLRVHSDGRATDYEYESFRPRRSEADEFTVNLSGPGSILLEPNAGKCDPSSPQQRSWKFQIGDTCWEIEGTLSDNTLIRDHVLIDQWAFIRLHYPVGLPAIRPSPLGRRCHDWCIDIPTVFDGHTKKTLYYTAAISLASAVYGGLHITAFWAPFPSAAERLLWRMSSLTVVGFFAVFFISIYVIGAAIDSWPTERVSSAPHEEPEVECSSVRAWIAFVLSVLGFWAAALLFYVFCRAFLVVECFITLAYLSPSQLATSGWSLYVPHLT